MGLAAFTNSIAKIDAVINAVVASNITGSGAVTTSGNQDIFGQKTFRSGLVASGGFYADEQISLFSPPTDDSVSLGKAAKRFKSGYFYSVSGTTGYFDRLKVNILEATLDLSVTGLSALTVTGASYFNSTNTSGDSFVSGNLNITGNSIFGGTSSFVGTEIHSGASTFKNVVIFDGATSFSAASNFNGAINGNGAVNFTGGAFTQSGTSSFSGTMSHAGSLFQNGNSYLTGTLGVYGNTKITGDVGITGDFFVRGKTTFTTGTSLFDRLTIVQNVDHTGDYNLTGALKISSSATISGGAVISGNVSIGGVLSSPTGNITVVNATTVSSSQINTSGLNSSGNTVFTANSGLNESIVFDGFTRQRIVASGFATSRIDNLTMDNFWVGGNAILGTGIWRTPYTGNIGEEALFLTGSTSSIANNNGMPTSVYGRVVRLTYVGTVSGSGCWFPNL